MSFRIAVFFILFVCLFCSPVYAQPDSVHVLGPRIESKLAWKGPCVDSTGKPVNPGEPYSQVYEVRKFRKRTQVEIEIKQIRLGDQLSKINLGYKGRIMDETSILPLGLGLGFKLVIGKSIENETRKYLYKLVILKYDQSTSCWHPLTPTTTYYEVWAKTISLAYSVGTEGTNDYFQIVEGWIKFD